MRLIKKNTIRYRSGNGRRGSVIVLVVAVLALLAVLGTVYIVSARAERQSAAAGSAAANLDYAQRSVNEVARQIVGEAVYDGMGTLGGQTSVGIHGDKRARTHDIHEVNAANPGYAFYNAGRRDQSWLAANLHRINVADHDITMPQARMVVAAGPIFAPAVFNPATGGSDINVLDGTGAYSGNVGFFNVVADPAGVLPDAIVQMLPFSEANGTRYRFGLRIIDTSRMANLNAGGLYDITAPTPQQLAGTFNANYSLASPTIFNATGTAFSAAGTVDVPGALNGAPSATNMGRYGALAIGTTYVPVDYWWEQSGYWLERPDVLPNSFLPFDLADELGLRAYGNFGTLAIPRPAVGYSAGQIWPNTLGNRHPSAATVAGNAYRGNYSTYTYSRDLRPIADPMDVAGNSLAYIVQPVGGAGQWAEASRMALWQLAGNVWPPSPACVAALPDVSVYTPLNAATAADRLVIAAVNIATAMRESGYIVFDEQCAFAANYLTNRWNSWSILGTQTLNSVTYNVYTLPAGPSFIDAMGPCLRTGVALPSGGHYISTLNSSTAVPANKIYLGHAAQPFINEVAAAYHFDSLSSAWVETDAAIELYNPYEVALALDDFRIEVNGNTISFAGKNQWIPPRGYFVLTKNTGGLDTTPTAIPNTAVKVDAGAMAATLAIKGAGQMYLQRKYIDRAGNPQWAAVDRYNVSDINGAGLPAAGGADEIDYVARANKAETVDPLTRNARWLAAVHDATHAEDGHTHGSAPDVVTLGSLNDSANAVAAHVPLWDRVPDMAPATGAYDPALQRLIPANVNEFNKIMRIGHQVDATTGNPAAIGATLSAQVHSKIATPDPLVTGTVYPVEASIHFDFRDAPGRYNFPATVPGAYHVGDERAVRLLSCLAFTDRLSDYGIDLGDNKTNKTINIGGVPTLFPDLGKSKLRVPGKINVNTASPEVLASIPVLLANPKLIGIIMAYRWRTHTGDARIPAGLQTTVPSVIDFTSSSDFPGYGIRSLDELMIPIWAYQIAIATAKGTSYATEFPTFALRDEIWGRMYNALTVRSDTFVAYAYLEAVRQNPKYSGPFDNSLVWYNTTAAAVTDDPNVDTHPLLRVARRRWVAIVDRSESNYGRYVPELLGRTPSVLVLDPRFTSARVVAEKDLPQ